MWAMLTSYSGGCVLHTPCGTKWYSHSFAWRRYEFGGKLFDSIDTLLAYVRSTELVGADGHSALRLHTAAGQTTSGTPPVPRPRPPATVSSEV
eukprot:m.507385 g.507385  ORF g.507385 m.507385 type:complete len:93 (+) comp21880_c0_seq2:732-1010(+)